MLPVPITVTAEEVNVLVVDTVDSQPPDWLRRGCLASVCGGGAEQELKGELLQWLESFHYIRPRRETIGLHIHE